MVIYFTELMNIMGPMADKSLGDGQVDLDECRADAGCTTDNLQDIKDKVIIAIINDTAVPTRESVAAHMKSKQLLRFGFVHIFKHFH